MQLEQQIKEILLYCSLKLRLDDPTSHLGIAPKGRRKRGPTHLREMEKSGGQSFKWKLPTWEDIWGQYQTLTCILLFYQKRVCNFDFAWAFLRSVILIQGIQHNLLSVYNVMSAACSEIIWLHSLLTEFGFPQFQPTPLHLDNTNLPWAYQTYWDRQSLLFLITDIFTKSMLRRCHNFLVDKLMLVNLLVSVWGHDKIFIRIFYSQSIASL